MRNALIIVLLAITNCIRAQVALKTMVPREPVVTGESFQVQYVLEDADKSVIIKAPSFDNFRFVTGPNNYSGMIPGPGGNKPLKNAVYTLEAGRPGTYIIRGATAVINGKTIRSNDVTVQVISQQEAAKLQQRDNGFNADYVLSPGEDVQKKIRQNLFVKVSVNKKTCFAGEPVLAVFKLYSRLQSKSDIVKNPGFYGFTIYDMVNLDDKVTETEQVNGKIFDVHTIRKVQLYPLQAGTYTIDPMEIVNKVEFSKSAVRKKTEQEIAEGMLSGDTGPEPTEATSVYESSLSTEPISITVKPVPEKNKPAGFSGATGNFRISAALVKNELAKNEEGILELTISGKGNFIQLDAPAIQWPAGIEGFSPVVKDSLDKNMLPLKGSRTFRYTFVCAAPGIYKLPLISFSFFNTDSNSFNTVSTAPLSVTGGTTEKKSVVNEEHKVSIAAQSEKKARMALLIVVALVLLVLVFYTFRKKEKTPAPLPETVIPQTPAVSEYLAPALVHAAGDPSLFYKELHGGAWNFLQQRFGLSGSSMNKLVLQNILEKEEIAGGLIQEILEVLTQCETGMYTATDPCEDKHSLYGQTVSILEQLEKRP
jgi:hypothetical protein